jgi:ubiquinone/menaquinone biosynthesis C-methylase UbiE
MKQLSRREFEKWAGTYDRSPLNYFLFRPAYITLIEEIARWHADNRRAFRVLDVGCGTGTLAGLIANTPWDARVTGVDYAASMCVEAASKARASGVSGHVHFVNGDSEHLPIADESIDVVTCSNSFHHYPRQATVVAEFWRILAPGGRLILIDGFRDCVVGWVVYDVIIDHVEGDVHHAPWWVIDNYFHEAGFRNIHRRKFGFLFPALATIGDK